MTLIQKLCNMCDRPLQRSVYDHEVPASAGFKGTMVHQHELFLCVYCDYPEPPRPGWWQR